MRHITKKQEPGSLTMYRSQLFKQYPAPGALPRTAWDDYKEKSEARLQLCEEQQYLCCFCMGPIKPTEKEMRIAHFLPQNPQPPTPAAYRGHVLDWRNLFGACTGHEGDAHVEEHCDVRQKNLRLHARLNPCTYQRGTLLYDAKGSVGSNDVDVLNDANEKLGLNIEYLKQQRRDALLLFCERSLPPKIKWDTKTLRKALEIYDGSGQGMVPPYCEVVRAYLEKKLASLSR